jgi:ribosomal protein S15
VTCRASNKRKGLILFGAPNAFFPSLLPHISLLLFPFPPLPPHIPAVATISDRIDRLTSHLAKNKQDKSSKRSLSILVSRRRRLMQYMIRKDYHSYRVMVGQLGLRPIPVIGSRHLPKTRTETHKQIIERNSRLKNRTSRGDRGH